MSKIALKIAGDAGDVSKVAALAVTFRRPRKNAEDLRVALGSERCVERAIPVAREALLARASGGTVTVQQRRFKRFGHIEPGVLQEGNEIVGRRTPDGILEVEEPHASQALARREPHQIGRMK